MHIAILLRSALLLCCLASSAAIAAPETTEQHEASADRDRENGDESWQIEQRQRWFEESRGLRDVADSRQLRATAAADLKRQVEATEAAHRAGGETWSAVGPSSMDMTGWIMGRVAGRVNAIAPHPTDDNIVYLASAAGGLWKTTNAGLSWAPLFDQVGTLPMGAIFVEPAAPNNVWAGTGDKNGGGCAGYFGQGVFLSADGGTTWTAKNGTGPTAMALSIVNTVAVQPTDSNVVLVGGAGACGATGTLSGPGVYRSADRGVTWTKVLSTNVEDLVFVPGTSTVYAGLINTGVQKSIDGGATWTNSSTGLVPAGSRMRLAMAPSDSNILYALIQSKLFRSPDAGATWTQVNGAVCEGQCTYNQALTVHPTDPNTLMVGTIRPARSTNGGANFTPMTSTWGNSQKVHQDTHVVLYSRLDSNRLWIGSDGGLWRSEDAGVSWLNMNSNLNIMQFYDIAVHPADPNIVFGGAQDNGSSGRRTTNLWSLTFPSGDGFMNAIDPTNPNIVFQTSYPSSQLPNVLRSTQGGASYTNMPTTGLVATSSFPWVTPLAIAGNQLFIASNVLYRTTTLGTSWTAVSPAMGSAASVITPELHGILMPTYVGTSGGSVYASADASIAAPVFTNVTGDYPGGRVADLAMDPGNAQRVFLARAGFGASRLYRSTTGGTTWVAVGAGLPNVPANSVAVDPIDTNRIFVGTDVGVFESTDGGDNFVAFSTGLPLGIVVSDLEIDSVPHVLTAGSYSRGAWRVILAGATSNLPPTADYNVAITGLQASFSDISIDTDGSIASVLWNFGDGSPTSTAINPNHTYPTYGTYSTTLTVTDNGGLTGSYSRVIRFPTPAVLLSNGVALPNQHAVQGDDLNYLLVVPPGATNLVFTTTGPANEDADITVRLGGVSPSIEALCESAGANANETCTLSAPAPGMYFLIVNAYSELTNVTVKGQYTAGDTIFVHGFQ